MRQTTDVGESTGGGRLDRLYGAGALHLIAVGASMAIAAYGFWRIVESPEPISVFIWFAGAIIAHDLIAFPLYSALSLLAFGRLGRAAESDDRRPGLGAVNHVRVPALLSGFAFIVWFPLILGLSEERYNDQTGLSTDVYLGRWLLLTAILFAASGVLYALRLRRARSSSQAGA